MLETVFVCTPLNLIEFLVGIFYISFLDKHKKILHYYV